MKLSSIFKYLTFDGSFFNDLMGKTNKKLKSVNSNFTPVAHSPKLNQAKTHFLSHLGEKKKYG